MLTLKVTEQAKSELKSIGRYTEREWGAAQRKRYLKALIGRFSWLAKNPTKGKERDDIKVGHYSYLEGKHLIFYTYDETALFIVAVLHQQMDFQSHL